MCPQQNERADLILGIPDRSNECGQIERRYFINQSHFMWAPVSPSGWDRRRNFFDTISHNEAIWLQSCTVPQPSKCRQPPCFDGTRLSLRYSFDPAAQSCL